MNLMTFIIVFYLYQPYLGAFSFFKNSSSESSETTVQSLVKKVEHSPQNSSHRYNLGVAYYKANNFELAAENFDKAVVHGQNNITITGQSLYNAGISHLQHTHSMLPEGWEQKDVTVDEARLDKAIQIMMNSVQNLDRYNKECMSDAKAKKALDTAQEILKKLQEKKKQQNNQNQDQQDNKDQQDQQNNKNQQDQKDKNQKQDQNKNDNQQSKDNSKEDKKQNQDQSDRNQGQQEHDDKQQDSEQNDNQQSNNKQNVDKEQDERNQGQDQGDGKEGADQPDNQPTDRNKQQLENNDAQNKEQSDINSQKAHDHQPSHQNPTETESENQEPSAFGSDETKKALEESTEMKGMRAVFESLQSDESKTQRKILMQQTGAASSQLSHGQKPW